MPRHGKRRRSTKSAELEKFCVDEWGEDGAPMREAILAAHDFFAAGMARVTEDEAVVFIIS